MVQKTAKMKYCLLFICLYKSFLLYIIFVWTHIKNIKELKTGANLIMFKHLERKIILSISITLIFCIIAISVVTCFILVDIFYNNYNNLSTAYIQKQKQNVDLYMKMINQISSRITENPEVIDALQTNTIDYRAISSLIDAVKASNPSIYGFTLYKAANTIYSTPSIAHLTSISELQKIKSVIDFWDTEQNDLWYFYPDKDYRSYIKYTSVNVRNSIVFYIKKLYGDNHIFFGYLLCAVDINSLYSYFNNNSGSTDAIYTYISDSNGIILPPKYNKKENQSLVNDVEKFAENMNPVKLTTDRSYRLNMFSLENSDLKIISAIPLASIEYNKKKLILTLAGFCLLFTLLSIVLAIFVSRSIIIPLRRLYSLMKNNSLDSLS
jgi:hypothetical protein